MSIVKELATFLHLYLHASGTPASDSASMDDLLKAAKLPSEEELGRMKPKHVKKIARALNALYNTWTQLNLERKKLTLWSTTDPEYHRIQTVIDRLEEIIRQSTEEKLEKYVHRVPALKPLPSNYTDINLTERCPSTAPDNDANVETKDAEGEATTQANSENEFSDDSDDSDDSDEEMDDISLNGALGSVANTPASVANTRASVANTEQDDVTTPVSLSGVAGRQSTNRLETQADVSVDVQSVDVGSELAAITAELAAIDTLDLQPIQTLAAITPAQLKKLVLDIEDISTVTKAINRTSICSHKKIFEKITESTKRKPSDYELQTIQGQKLQRLTKKDKDTHYCKGALIFKSGCDKSNIRVCKCTADSGNPCRFEYGVHVICGKHYDSLSVAYGEYKKDDKLDAWKKLAKNLGSNTAAANV